MGGAPPRRHGALATGAGTRSPAMPRIVSALRLIARHAPGIVTAAIAIVSIAATGGGDFPRRI
jgi:hypothetical protein